MLQTVSPTPFSFEKARRNMVDSQLKTNRVSNSALIKSFSQTAREVFAPQELKELAYTDDHLSFDGTDRVMISPVALGRLLEAAQFKHSDHVLIINCGTGYSAAILSPIVSHICLEETDKDLHKQAQNNMKNLHIKNANFNSESKSYDVIFIEGSVEQIPHPLFDQLNDQGRLITFFKTNSLICEARIYLKDQNHIAHRTLFETNLPVLDNFKKAKGFSFS